MNLLWPGILFFVCFSCCHEAYLGILWLCLYSQCCYWHCSAFAGDFLMVENCISGCRWFPNLQTYKSESDKCQLKYSISLQLMVLSGNLVDEQGAAVISCLLRPSNSHYLKIVFVLF